MSERTEKLLVKCANEIGRRFDDAPDGTGLNEIALEVLQRLGPLLEAGEEIRERLGCMHCSGDCVRLWDAYDSILAAAEKGE
jgi:hypothetical protein